MWVISRYQAYFREKPLNGECLYCPLIFLACTYVTEVTHGRQVLSEWQWPQLPRKPYSSASCSCFSSSIMFLLSQVPFLSCSSSDYQQAFLLIDLTHSATEKDPFFFFFILMEKLAHRNTLLALCCRQEWMASAGAERGVAIWVSAVIGC